jgi:hypothetical protein
VLGPAIVDAAPGVLPKAVPAVAVKMTGGPTPPPSALDVSTLGSPTAPPGPPAPHATPPASRMDAPPPPELSPSLFEAPPAPSVATRRDAAGMPGAATAPSGTNPFDTIAATGGPLPAGSSLLAVLASYVIPGAGAPPATMLLLFVQLAVILAAFFAPRLGLGERALALARVGPRSGYRTVLTRPG